MDSDIFITGSNSNLLSGELATHIAGRYVEFKIYSFSFKEFIKYSDNLNIVLESKSELSGMENFSNDSVLSGSYKELQEKFIENNYGLSDNKINKLFFEYVKVGGFPFLLNLEEEERYKYLEDIYNSIILKDIIKRNEIRDIDILECLIQYIMANIGQTFSANSIYKYYKKEYRLLSSETIYNYLKYCENASLIEKVQREDLKGKKLLNFKEKFYLVDWGFREAIFRSNTRDIGQILENIVYLELIRKGYNVTIGLVKDLEIDFVARKRNKKVYIQVSYILASEKTKNREFASLLKINDNYPKDVLSLDDLNFSDEGIIHMNIVDFLLSDEF